MALEHLPPPHKFPAFCPRCGARFVRVHYIGRSEKTTPWTEFYGPRYACGTDYWPEMRVASFSPEACPEVLK